MFGLQSLGELLGDTELRALLTQVATRKIQTDLKTLQAHGELVRRLGDSSRKGGGTDPTLKQIVREHLDYYSALIDLSDGFHQHLLDMLAAHGRSEGGDQAANGLTLPLEAPPGATVRAPFKVSNNRPEPIAVTFRAMPFVSADGNRLIASNIAFDPPQCEIVPGAEQVVEAVIPVAAEFTVGQTYFTTLSAAGLEAMQIVVRLTVTEPSPSEDMPAPEMPAPDLPAPDMPAESAAPVRKRAAGPAAKPRPRKAG